MFISSEECNKKREKKSDLGEFKVAKKPRLVKEKPSSSGRLSGSRHGMKE